MKEIYFASANGYRGFRSYFNEVFSEEGLDKLFILKGGPGTGKSTLMKRLAEHFSGITDRCELILCSSDKDSLDGVILTKRDKRVAMIDGTAPHMMDTKFPGAVSEIINLGEGWDSGALTLRKSEILSLTEKKAELYKEGYEALRLAGYIKHRILSIVRRHFDKKRAEISARILLSENEAVTAKSGVKLLSSFSKIGSFSLPLTGEDNEIRIYGKHYSAEIYLSLLKNYAEPRGLIKTVIPSSLDEDMTMGIITKGRAYVIGSDGICAEEFLSDPTPEETEEISKLEDMHEGILSLAARYFSGASERHFLLEDIYSTYMNYEANDKKLEDIKLITSRVLDI